MVDEGVQIYQSKGFTAEEATQLINLMTKKPEYTNYFIDHMMVQELGQVVPDPSASPLKNGVVTFISFIVFGFIPLLGYIIFWATDYHDKSGQLGITCGITLFTLFALGATQAKLIKQSLFKQGLLMMINGGLAAGAAYLAGWGLQRALSGDSGSEGCL